MNKNSFLVAGLSTLLILTSCDDANQKKESTKSEKISNNTQESLEKTFSTPEQKNSDRNDENKSEQETKEENKASKESKSTPDNKIVEHNGEQETNMSVDINKTDPIVETHNTDNTNIETSQKTESDSHNKKEIDSTNNNSAINETNTNSAEESPVSASDNIKSDVANEIETSSNN